jgi:uncharacterized protein
MTDASKRSGEIETPCIKLCVIHPETRLCMGCHRSLDEISGWSRMTPEVRREIMAVLPARATLLAPRRKGGRAARLRAIGREEA